MIQSFNYYILLNSESRPVWDAESVNHDGLDRLTDGNLYSIIHHVTGTVEMIIDPDLRLRTGTTIYMHDGEPVHTVRMDEGTMSFFEQFLVNHFKNSQEG